MFNYSRKKNVINTLILSISLVCLIITEQLPFLDNDQLLFISIIRQIIGYFFLAYIPGNLFLKIINITEIDTYDELAYSVGLSLSIVMVTGLFINFCYPLIGITRPISVWSLLLTFCIINLIFSFFIDFRNCKKSNIKAKNRFYFLKENYLPCMYILLLPLLSITGAKYMALNNNFILLGLIVLISIVPIMVATERIIKEPVYPLAIYMIALALLLQTTMVSPYPMRINVDAEYFYQQLVIQNEFWTSNIPMATNTALSIVMLAPIFEQILNVSVYWMFRCGYPILFAFVPFILYQTYSRQTNKKIAFLSVCFFMFYFYFYLEAILLKRQQIALIYFTLLLLLFTAKDLSMYKKKVLLIIFTFSLVISHYSVSMIALLIFCIVYVISSSIEADYILSSSFKSRWSVDHSSSKFSKTYILIFVALQVTWFLFVGSGKLFHSITDLGKGIYLDFFLQSGKSIYINQALGAGFFDVSLHGKIYRLLQYSSQLFIITGSISLIIKKTKMSIEYVQLITAATILFFIMLIVPYISEWINIFRLYFVFLLILSPACIIGAEVLYNVLFKYLRYIFKNTALCIRNAADNSRRKNVNFRILFVALFLIPYFLYNSGFVFEVGNFNLENSNIVKIPKSPSLTNYYNNGYYNEQEITAAKTIAGLIDQKTILYGDAWIGNDLLSAWNRNSIVMHDENDINEKPHYIFLRYGNIKSKKYSVATDYQELDVGLFNFENKIYDNGNAIVLGTS